MAFIRMYGKRPGDVAMVLDKGKSGMIAIRTAIR